MTLPFLPGFLSLARIAGVMVLASCLFYRRHSVSFPQPAMWAFGTYLAFFWFRGLFVSEAYETRFLTTLLTLMQLLILTWLVSKPLGDQRLIRDTLICFALASAFLVLGSLLGLPGFSESWETRGIERTSAFGSDPNFLGTMLAIAMVIVVGFLLEKRLLSPAMKFWLGVPGLLLPIGVISTGSRTAILALVAGISMYLLPFGRIRSLFTKVAFTLGCLVILLALVMSDRQVGSRLLESYETGDLSGRDRILTAFVELFSEQPFWGWGPVEYRYELGLRLNGVLEEKDSHNLYAHLLLEVGVIGTIPFVAGLLLCLRSLWRARNTDCGKICFAVFATLMIANLALNWAFFKLLWLLIAISLAGSGGRARHSPAVVLRPLPQFRS